MINAMRASRRRRDDFGAVNWKLVTSGVMPQAVYVPTSDTKPRWFSTFHMFNQAYKARKAIQVTAQKSDDRKEHYIAKNSWAENKQLWTSLKYLLQKRKLGQAVHTSHCAFHVV